MQDAVHKKMGHMVCHGLALSQCLGRAGLPGDGDVPQRFGVGRISRFGQVGIAARPVGPPFFRWPAQDIGRLRITLIWNPSDGRPKVSSAARPARSARGSSPKASQRASSTRASTSSMGRPVARSPPRRKRNCAPSAQLARSWHWRGYFGKREIRLSVCRNIPGNSRGSAPRQPRPCASSRRAERSGMRRKPLRLKTAVSRCFRRPRRPR